MTSWRQPSFAACLAFAGLFALGASGCGAAPDESGDDESTEVRDDAASVPELPCASALGRRVVDRVWGSRLSEGTVPEELIYTSRNAIRPPLVNPEEIFPAIRDAIAAAHYEVDFETFDWEPAVFTRDDPAWQNDASMVILDGLVRLEARLKADEANGIAVHLPVVVRILTDGAHRDALDKSWRPAIAEARALLVQLANLALDPRYVEVHAGVHEFRTWGSLHSKALAVDGWQGIVMSANPQPVNTLGNSWHEVGLFAVGEAGMAVQRDFDDAWADGNSGEVPHCNIDSLNAPAVCDVIPNAPIVHAPEVASPNLDAVPELANACVPVVAATRRPFNVEWEEVIPGSNDPQDRAWMGMIENASVVKIESPNINSHDMKDEIVQAVTGCTEVRIVAPLGFNDTSMRQGFGPLGPGGGNAETIEELYSRLRGPEDCARLHIRWFSRDGLVPHPPGWRSSHAKYMSIDGQLAMVGSGNQDSVSWYLIRETNLLVDDPVTTAAYDQRLFDADYQLGIDVPTWARRLRDGEIPIDDVLLSAMEGDPIGWAAHVAGACGL